MNEQTMKVIEVTRPGDSSVLEMGERPDSCTHKRRSTD